MEELLNGPRYRYAAIFGSALFAAVFLNDGFSRFWAESAFVAVFCVIVAAHAGAMMGWFLMTCLDWLRGRVTRG